MTRLELLLGYTPARVRDSWKNLGQQVVSNIIRVYTKFTLFQINEATSALYHCLVFCDSDLTVPDSFSWINYTIADRSVGTIQDNNFIISPNFHIVLTATELGDITDPYDTTFIPFQEVVDDIVIIDDDELNRILIEAGVPFINLQELEYDRDSILRYMVYPALQKFYKFFPLVKIETQYLSNSSFAVPLPQGAIGCARVNMIPGLPTNQANSHAPNNPLLFWIDEIVLNANAPAASFNTPGIVGNRRQGYQGNNFATFVLERAVRQGIQNYSRRTRIHFDVVNGQVTGYCNMRGFADFYFTYMSNDWSMIPNARLDEVRNLCKANVLRAFAMLRMQAKSDMPGVIDYSQFLTRADQLEEQVVELWQSATKAPLVRT